MRLVSSHTFTSELSYLKTVRPAGVPIRWKNLQNMLIADHWKEKHSNIYIYIPATNVFQPRPWVVHRNLQEK